MIKLFVYQRSDGRLVYESLGITEYVIYDILPEHDFTLTPPPDYDHVWRWIENKWVADEPEAVPIEEIQATMWTNIKDKRSLELSKSILVESVDKMFQTDPNSIAEYNNIASMIALDNYDPIEWKTEDNTFVLLTVELFKELQRAISGNTQRLFKVAEQHKAAMLKETNPLEYDYSEGWV